MIEKVTIPEEIIRCLNMCVCTFTSKMKQNEQMFQT